MNATFAPVGLVCALLLSGLNVQAASDFYKGKRVRMIVSSTPGGGNDTYTRLIARHIPKYIPGNPTMVVQNMPGAGGLRAADYLYRNAPRDGTVMEQINWNVWNYQVIGDDRASFDFRKINAIGAAAIENAIMYFRKDRYKSLKELRDSGKLATVGVSGRQSGPFIMGKIVEQVLGAELFEMVMGYPGARQYSLALRQGEIDASGNTTGSFWDQLGDFYKAGELVIFVQSGTVDGKRDPDFPDVPMITELAETPEGKEIAAAAFSLGQYGRPYAFPPGVPEERLKIMREAFWNTMQDKQFLSEAKKLGRIIQPVRGEQLQEIWKRDLNPPPKKLEIVKEIFGG